MYAICILYVIEMTSLCLCYDAPKKTNMFKGASNELHPDQPADHIHLDQPWDGYISGIFSKDDQICRVSCD